MCISYIVSEGERGHLLVIMSECWKRLYNRIYVGESGRCCLPRLLETLVFRFAANGNELTRNAT
jgi:hypothetical protein